MNLIEQLGGYEKAKAAALNYRNSGDALTAKKFESACLEHRRANNIFEVGDKVVSNRKNLHLFYDKVLEIDFFRNIGKFEWARFTNGNDYRVDALRHATPQEIEAGHRL